MEALQKRFQSEVEKLQEIERDRQQKITQLKQLEEQLIENSAVRDEFQLLLGSPDAAASAFRVFKLIGPVLVEVAAPEAKENVDKRVAYIEGEKKRIETLLKDTDKKQEAQQAAVIRVQQQIQQTQVKLAMRS